MCSDIEIINTISITLPISVEPTSLDNLSEITNGLIDRDNTYGNRYAA